MFSTAVSRSRIFTSNCSSETMSPLATRMTAPTSSVICPICPNFSSMMVLMVVGNSTMNRTSLPTCSQKIMYRLHSARYSGLFGLVAGSVNIASILLIISTTPVYFSKT